jgi:hypothetical protein
VTVKDISNALKIWGPSIAMIKGKTICKTPPPAQQDVIAILKEFCELHKRVILTIDIFFANSIPFLALYSLNICLLLVTHMENRKADTIFKAFKTCTTITCRGVFKLCLSRAMESLSRLSSVCPL